VKVKVDLFTLFISKESDFAPDSVLFLQKPAAFEQGNGNKIFELPARLSLDHACIEKIQLLPGGKAACHGIAVWTYPENNE